MPLPLYATTELESINTMLSVIGETPLSNLLGANFSAAATAASYILKETSRQVLLRGWRFNTQKKITLTPDTYSHEIAVADSVLKVIPTGSSSSLEVIVKNGKLYNLEDNSFVFNNPVTANTIILVPFDDLPQVARHYLTIKAARSFQNRYIGSTSAFQMTVQDEIEAWREMRKDEALSEAPSMLRGINYLRRTF